MASASTKLRLAVIGQGHFAQAAVLPALRRTRGAALTALVSGEPDKLAALGDRYRVPHDHRGGYDDLDRLLGRGDIDAVYIVLPNDLHAEYAVRAAHRGCHVLCEKPMAPSVEECEAMIEACADSGVHLMIAYRLHFEPANLAAIDLVTRGELGEPRIFNSVFTMQVREGNVRVQDRPGAGPLFDLGVYCVNAARYLFRADPVRIVGVTVTHPGDPRFVHAEESVAATLSYDDGRIATFVASFGAADRARYEVIGTRGALSLDNAYEYTAETMTLEVTRDGKSRRKRFGKRDQIAAEIEYFARCVRDGVVPEPSGREGLADVRTVLAIYESARTGRAIELGAVERDRPPTPDQRIHVPAHGKPPMVGGVASASK
jgi:predicted dehydrogenase